MPAWSMPPGDGVDSWSAWATRQTEVQAWVKDLRFRFVAISPALARSCGAQPEDMAGRTELGFFSPALVRQFRRDDLRVVALNQPAVVVEYGPGGRFATLKRPLRDGRGRVCGTVGIAYAWAADRPGPPLSLGPVVATRPSAPAWLQDLRARMQRDFRTPLRVHRLAADAGRHPNHLSRAFRRHFGVSTVEWLHRLRVAWAAEAVMGGTGRLSVVAQQAGFADQAHLTRVFKRYVGLTPGQYRRALAPVQ